MAKSPDDPTLGLDASDWFATVDKVNASTVAFANRMNALATQIEASGSAASNFVLKISDVDAQGRKLTATLKNTDEGMRVFGKAVSQTTGIQEANIRKMKEQTKAFEAQVRAQAAALAQQLKNQFLLQGQGRGLTATAAEKQRVLQNIGQIQELVEKGRISATRANSVIASVLAGSTQTYTGASRQVQTVTNQMIRNTGQLGAAWQKNANQIINANNQQGKSFKQVGDRGQEAAVRVLISWRDLGRIFTIQALHNVIRAFINSLREAIQTSQQFEIRISEIRTLSQDNQLSFDQWAKATRRLSDEFGNPILDVAEGTYEAISNQIAKGAETADFMAKALKFAAVTVSTTADSVNLLSSVLNAYKLNVSDVDRVSAELFRTIDLGRVRAQDLANEFGRVAPVAASLNISLEELNAAIATITIQGVTPSETLTSIFGIMNKLLKPTDEMVKFLHGLGFESGKAAVAALGFDGVLKKIVQSAQAGNIELSDLFNEIRSTRGIVAITRAMENYNSTLNAIRTDSMDKFIAAQDIINESAGKRFEIQLNRIKNIFVTDFGQRFIENLVSVGDASTGTASIISGSFTGILEIFGNLEKSVDSAGHSVFQLSDIFRSLIDVAKNLLTIFLTYRVTVLAVSAATALTNTYLTFQAAKLFALSQGYSSATASSIAFQLSIAKLPAAFSGFAGLTALINPIIVGITLAAGAFLFFQQRAEAAIDAAIRKHDEFNSALQKNIDSETQSVVEGFRTQEAVQARALDDRLKADLNYVANATKIYFQFAEEQKKAQKVVNAALKDSLDLNTDSMRDNLRQLEEQAKKSADNIKSAKEALFRQEENLIGGRFNRQIKLLPEPEQIRSMFSEIDRLQTEAAKKISSPTGDANVAAENLKQANKLQEQADKITNDLLDRQVDVAKKRKEIEEQIAKLNLREKDTAAIREQRENVQSIAKLEAEARRSSGTHRNQILDQIKLQKQAAQDQLEAARDQSVDDQRAQRGLELQQELANLEEQQSALAARGDIDVQINAELARRKQLNLDYQKQQDQINAAAAKQLELEKKKFEQLKTVFESITKFKLPEIKTKEEADKALADFENQVKKATDLGLKDQNVLFEIAKKRAELEAQVDAEIQKHRLDTNAKTLQDEKEKLVKHLEELRAAREKAVKDFAAGEKQAPEIASTLLTLLPNVPRPVSAEGDLRKIFDQLGNAAALTAEQLAEIQVTFSRVITGLGRAQGLDPSQVKVGNTTLATLSKEFQDALDKIANAPDRQAELEKAAQDAQDKLKTLGVDFEAAQKALQASKDATIAQNDYTTAITQSIATMQQLQDATKGAADNLARLAGQQGPTLPPIQGPLHKAFGGWIPRGTDTVPAMLTPGEFVVNAFAAQRFRYLLEGINTRYYSGGGAISNVRASSIRIPDSFSFGNASIGDIHVHGVPISGNISVDAREMGRAIRNEIRKGTVLPPRSQE